MTDEHKNKISGLVGVVLCGGKATRMQGRDKGLVEFHNEPLAQYGINALQACEQIIINANRNHDTYQRLFALPVVTDANQSFDGPLAGLLAAMQYAKSQNKEWVISLPCDSPFIASDYVKQMWQASRESDKQIFIANDGFNQPVFTLIHTALVAELEAFLQGDQKKILAFYQSVGYEKVLFTASDWFINLNSLEELADAKLPSKPH